MKQLLFIRLGLLFAIMLFTCLSHLAFATGTREGKVYTVSAPVDPNIPDADARLMRDAGILPSSYTLYTTSGEWGAQREYRSKTAKPEELDALNRRVASAIDRLHGTMPDLKDVIKELGSPTKVLIHEDQQRTFINAHYDSVDFFYDARTSAFREIRIESQDSPFLFRHGIRVGSTLKKVIASLGEPARIVHAREIDFGSDATLSIVEHGSWTQQYIMYVDVGVRIFFKDESVTAMYLFKPGSGFYASQEVRDNSADTAKDAPVEPYSDVRNHNLLSLGSALTADVLRTLQLNLGTKADERVMKTIDRIIEEGKNPGLGVRALHARGITGAGVTVAIIDQNLPGTGHSEYKGKVTKYYDTGTGQSDYTGSMHGPAVLSLLVGEQAGTAPGARVFFAAAPSWTGNASFYGKALRWIVDENQKLPKTGKIRVVSVSAAPSGQGSPFTKNGGDWDKAVKLAASKGILVLDCTTTHGKVGPCYYDPSDAENVQKALPGWPGQSGPAASSLLLAPTSYRSQAEAYYAPGNSWQYTGRGGLSWGIPWTAGVLAMGWQVNPSLEPDAIMRLLADTAYKRPDGSRIIDPIRFIAEVEKSVK
jgi:serine protease AprX